MLPEDARAVLDAMTPAEVIAFVSTLPADVVAALVAPNPFPPELVALAVAIKANGGRLPDEP